MNGIGMQAYSHYGEAQTFMHAICSIVVHVLCSLQIASPSQIATDQTTKNDEASWKEKGRKGEPAV